MREADGGSTIWTRLELDVDDLDHGRPGDFNTEGGIFCCVDTDDSLVGFFVFFLAGLSTLSSPFPEVRSTTLLLLSAFSVWVAVVVWDAAVVFRTAFLGFCACGYSSKKSRSASASALGLMLQGQDRPWRKLLVGRFALVKGAAMVLASPLPSTTSDTSWFISFCTSNSNCWAATPSSMFRREGL